MEQLRGAIRTYAWGSRTAIAEFTGRPVPAVHPEAELWLGAHPGDPAFLETASGEVSLLDVLADDPEGQLGPVAHARFGDRLPFLVKVLAADEPLSLQAHPSAMQAIEGYEREERLGVPVSSPIRNYRDTSHKPELLVALQPFEALAGFRPAARTIELLRALAVSDLDPFIDLLGGQSGDERSDLRPETDMSDADGLRALFTTWITAPQPDLDVLVPAVLEGAIQYLSAEAGGSARLDGGEAKLGPPHEPSGSARLDEGEAKLGPPHGPGEFAAEAKMVLELGERYPGDAGVLAALLLNRVSLAPGEAIFLPAGNLHTYLHGVGLEVMANSDNVLRGGLTPKHVDVPELLRVLDFTPTTEEALRTATYTDGPEVVYQTPAEEFAVSRLTLDGSYLGHEVDAPARHDGPQILVCTEGSVTVHAKSKTLTLHRGESAWVPCDDGPIRLLAQQPAALCRATIGL